MKKTIFNECPVVDSLQLVLSIFSSETTLCEATTWHLFTTSTNFSRNVECLTMGDSSHLLLLILQQIVLIIRNTLLQNESNYLSVTSFLVCFIRLFTLSYLQVRNLVPGLYHFSGCGTIGKKLF